MPASPPIVIMSFIGEQPRLIPRLLPDNGATSAIDSRLDDGGLTPMRDTPMIADATSGVSATWKSIYYYNGKWIGWDSDHVCAQPGPVAQDRLYYTGDGGVPKMRIADTIYNLAVPRPTVKPTATIVGGGTAGAEVFTRGYVYSWVTDINGIQEESEPSSVSNLVEWKSGQSVTLSGFQAPTAGRGIAYQRIYRLQTGLAGTFFYFIADRTSNFTADYSDIIAVDRTAEPCPSINYNAPPANLEGLVAMPNGMMAAFVGKKLYFSEPYKPHAWPEIYILTTEHPIVGLGAIGNSLVVATDAHPYFVTGGRPDAMSMTKTEQLLPCINHRSLVDLGYFIAYCSHEGLVVCSGDGNMQIVTSQLFTRENWEDFNPYQMICGQLNRRYVAFYGRRLDDGTDEAGALFFDLGNPVFLFRTATTADAVCYRIERSALFYKVPGKAEIRQIDADNAGRKILYWRSKEFVLPYSETYGAFQVDGDVDTTLLDETAYAELIDITVAANLVLILNGGTYKYPDPPAPTVWTGSMDPPTVPPLIEGKNASIGGDIDAMPIGVLSVNGDILTYIPYQPVSIMTATVYCDKLIIGSSTKVNTPVRLPSGFRGRTWEVDVFTNQRVHRIAVAKSMDDLKRLP